MSALDAMADADAQKYLGKPQVNSSESYTHKDIFYLPTLWALHCCCNIQAIWGMVKSFVCICFESVPNKSGINEENMCTTAYLIRQAKPGLCRGFIKGLRQNRFARKTARCTRLQMKDRRCTRLQMTLCASFVLNGILGLRGLGGRTNSSVFTGPKRMLPGHVWVMRKLLRTTIVTTSLF